MLPPVGNTITLQAAGKGLPHFDNYHSILLDSGTSALALSLLIARLQPGNERVEVIIPAYTCPDLVTACKLASVKPVLCDIGNDDPGYDLNMLETLVTEKTLAVIAVNFLGIRERLEAIRTLTGEKDVLLIEDNAQWYPEPFNGKLFTGDMVCLSFGRGKPVSLLGGGAILISSGLFKDHVNEIHQIIRPSDSGLHDIGYYLKLKSYNLFIHPHLYGFVSRLPGIRLGETRYHEPATITCMDDAHQNLLQENIRKYIGMRREIETFYRQKIPDTDALINLPVKYAGRTGRLLRYPLLFENKQGRDRLLGLLNQEGLGASDMYRKPMWEIDNIPSGLRMDTTIKNAAVFADRLLTLPVHENMNLKHAGRICEILSAGTDPFSSDSGPL